MTPRLLTFILACSVSATALAANPAPGRPGALERAFWLCTDLGQHGLAGDLLSVSASEAPAAAGQAFSVKHAQAIRPGSLEVQHPGGPDQTLTSVALRAEVVAGVNVRTLTATTCTGGGCDLVVWTIDFGRLTLANKVRVLTWAHRAPSIPWDSQWPNSVKPRYYETDNGHTHLVCDIST